ncbi:hypothetical protein GW17_00002244 [Ensete ventricosum]|nr:hypothetical protein GW17_00002244 [Ensete ventricosum]
MGIPLRGFGTGNVLTESSESDGGSGSNSGRSSGEQRQRQQRATTTMESSGTAAESNDSREWPAAIAASGGHTTGWFSGAILRTLRLHVSIRFLSLYPNDAAKQLTNYTRELFERSKKNGALSRLQKCEKEDQLVNRDICHILLICDGTLDPNLLSADTNCAAEVASIQSNEHGHMDQDRTDNYEIEDEEEEEEFDGYESPPVIY